MAEPTVNQLVTTTINNYHKSFADNVTNSNAVTALLRKGDRVRVILRDEPREVRGEGRQAHELGESERFERRPKARPA